MLIALSPAKKLLPFTSPYQGLTTSPVFEEKTEELIGHLKTKSIAEIAILMHISMELASLNYQRFQSFQLGKFPPFAYPAIFLFQGDVYRNLKPELWDKSTLEYAQTHLNILSGLYGLLRPLDCIQPYRLEMATQLRNSCGKNLYNFWKFSITQELNNRLISQDKKLFINLASEEYSAAVDLNSLIAPTLTIHFKECKNNSLKVIGIQAKKARGAMANFILENRIEDSEAIKEFTLLNYRFCVKSSTDQHFNFIREPNGF